MRKIQILIPLIAIAFAGFAFVPVQHSVLGTNTVIVDAENAGVGRCQAKYESETKFTKCAEKWSEDLEAVAANQQAILEKF